MRSTVNSLIYVQTERMAWSWMSPAESMRLTVGSPLREIVNYRVTRAANDGVSNHHSVFQ